MGSLYFVLFVFISCWKFGNLVLHFLYWVLSNFSILYQAIDSFPSIITFHLKKNFFFLFILDLRVGFSVTENGRSCAIKCRPRSPVVALDAPLSIVKVSRYLLN